MDAPDARSFPDIGLPPQGTPMWHIREAPLPLGRWRCRTIGDDTHDDSEVVTGPIDTGDSFVYGYCDVDAMGRSVMHLNPVVIPDAPALWFVALPDRTDPRPAMTLVGFATDHLPPGTIIGDPEFFSLPVDPTEQVGAISWWFEEGVVDQLFIAEQWRRHHLARLFTAAAQGFQVHNGWPPKLTSNGRRTALGEHLATRALFPDRYAPLEVLAPPMDPTPDGGSR
ncbi:unannotated protein [freshwater metagenome]|uniref:Unannotated protein n=1 Tax=freshwater metagenome TaxID=449393 RepID=A0A6J6HAA5_9ZZZZ|nr:hypothetical protein [Actinomycetota bacterium]